MEKNNTLVNLTLAILIVAYVAFLVCTCVALFKAMAGSQPGTGLMTCAVLHFIADAFIAFFAGRSLWKQYRAE